MKISAKEYHRKTSYSRDSLGGHFLDWNNRPSPYKRYKGLDTIKLPWDLHFPEERLSEVIDSYPEDPDQVSITIEKISLILILAYTITSRVKYGNEVFYYRSVPSAGALYPCEIYIAWNGTSGIEPGLFHYSIEAHSLTRLRKGSPVIYLYESFESPRSLSPILTFFITAIFFRSSWKYRDRAYRYHLLDCGHLLEALVLSLKALRLPFKVDYDFNDERTNKLLGIDMAREVCLAAVQVYGKIHNQGEEIKQSEEMEIILPEASCISPGEVDYPMIREIHASTSRVVKPSGPQPQILLHLGLNFGQVIDAIVPEKWPEVMNYFQAIKKRRSMRNFIRKEIKEECLGAMLMLLSKGGKEEEFPYRDSISLGLIACCVDGIDSGFYLIDFASGSLKLISKKNLIYEMARACLDQDWLGMASIHFLFLTNLEVLEKTWGPRGYRYAMINSGRLGQRIYLGSTAMGLGCCGIGAFYDNEISKILGLNEASTLLYLVACGYVREY
jgi:SagB-type dehydrogenase family enzyme